MTAKEALENLLDELPEARVQQLLDYAQFLNSQAEAESWNRFGQMQLARAYGDDEPEYTEDDLKPE